MEKRASERAIRQTDRLIIITRYISQLIVPFIWCSFQTYIPHLFKSLYTNMAAEGIEKLTEAPVEFIKEGTQFIQKCTKPTKREYLNIVRAVGIGFLMMGVVGYIIKLVHIPIRYLIV